MVIDTNSFEGGTNGTAVTTANSGGASGTAFAAATSGLSFSNVRAHASTLSCTFTSSAATSYAAWYPGAATNMQARGYFWLDQANAGGEFHLIGIYEANGNSVMIFRLTASNVLRLYKNIAPTSNTWAPTTTMPIGQWVRAELLVEQGTTTSNGRARVGIFADNSTTPLAESGWVTGLNLGVGTNTMAHIRFGKMGAGSNATGVYMDDLEIRTGSDYTGTWIGPTSLPIVSTTYRWNAGTSAYVPLESYRWDAGTSAYVALDRATP